MANIEAIGMDVDNGQFKIASPSDVIMHPGGTNSSGVQTSGAVPTITVISGTAIQIVSTRDFYIWVPITFNPTALLTATAKIEISPDGVTYSTVSTENFPALLGLLGTQRSITIPLRAGYYVKITTTNATIGTVSYW